MVKITVPTLAVSEQVLRTQPNNPDRPVEQDSTNLSLDAKVFIFDKDGTLLTHDHFIPIMEKRLELIVDRYKLTKDQSDALSRLLGLDPNTRQIIQRGTMFIAREDTQILIITYLSELGFRFKQLKKEISNIFQDTDEQIELDKVIRPFPEVPPFLERLKCHGVKIAIATHDTTAAAINQLALADIDKYMDLIIGLDYDDDILHKPSPSMFNKVCSEFEVSPKDCVVVGDSVNDVLMGVRGGAGLAIGVLTGEHTANDFKEFDALISSLDQIKIDE